MKGIGPTLAKKLVERFGAQVLAVIESRTADLQTVDGIGRKRRERIARAWQQAKQVREIRCCGACYKPYFPRVFRSVLAGQ